MYPLLRMIWQLLSATRKSKLPYDGTHISQHICWPWDLDFMLELNNGRTLTLYDLGRMPLGLRIGLMGALRRNKWSMTVAGSTPRYRRRVRIFDKVTMKSRGVGWDDKFIYVEQSMWLKNGECASHVLIRSAVTNNNGIVPADEVAKACGYTGPRIAPPQWVRNWCDADGTRPWPPMADEIEHPETSDQQILA